MTLKERVTNVAKYLAHGALFAVMTYGVGLLWGYLLLVLFLTGAILGIILAFVILMLVWGIVNSFIAKLLWFPVEKGWKVWLGQGFALAVIFAVLSIPLLIGLVFLAQLSYPWFYVALVLVEVVYALIQGFIAMRVARHWKKRGVGVKIAAGELAWTPEPELTPSNPKSLHCPRCGSTKMVVAKDNSALCLDCQRGIRKEKLGGAAG